MQQKLIYSMKPISCGVFFLFSPVIAASQATAAHFLASLYSLVMIAWEFNSNLRFPLFLIYLAV